MSSRPPFDPVATPSIGACPSCGADVFAGTRFCVSCGSAVTIAEEAELLGDLQQATLGEYEILGILGRGGMGLVYLAQDLSLGRKVAIKVLPPFLLQGQAAVERFRREARTAASLRHRHITSVFGLRETPKLVFFVMEYVEGRSLDAVLHAAGTLAIEAVEAIAHDTATALAYAHRREVVHRDVKPGNILIDVDGMAMITDFGVAKVSTAQGLTSTGSTVGSPKYMSPEQWSGSATSSSDQYGLGCVLYQLVTGRAPFEGESLTELMTQHLFALPREPAALRPDCPPTLSDGVMRMLAKDPTQRFETLDVAVTAMFLRSVPQDDPVRQRLARAARRSHDVQALPKTPKSPIPINHVTRPPVTKTTPTVEVRRSRWPWLAAAAIPVLAAGAYLLLRPPKPTVVEPVAQVEIAETPSTLVPGARIRLVARPKNAAGEMIADAPVVWSTSNASVAFVSADTLTAVAPGTVTLTAASRGREAHAAVTVQPAASGVASLDLTPREASIAPGATVQARAIIRDAAGKVLADRPVAWSSSDPGIASVTSAGLIRGVAAGTAVVSGTSEGRAAMVTVTVAASPTVSSIEVAPRRITIATGQAYAPRAIVRDSRGASVTRRVRWVSIDPGVATVSAAGVVTGVRAGTTSLTASAEGVTSTPVEVTVAAPPAPVAARPAPAARTAVLQLLVTPWANVFVDGAPLGQRTRLVDTLSAGTVHRLRFERDGFATLDTVVTLQPNEQRLLRIQIVPRTP